jgi:pyruvate, orthophosphate dikinase
VEKMIYSFGGGKAEGRADMKNQLGGKGANLAEMSNLGIPVPPGFTISTSVCKDFYAGDKNLPDSVKNSAKEALSIIENLLGKKFGNSKNPLLLSIRSGARVSMPGMMDTILNLGLNDETVMGLSVSSGNSRFAWDSYRRFVQMYSNVVMGMNSSLFEMQLEDLKHDKKITDDTDLSEEDLKNLVGQFKEQVFETTGKVFPDSPMDQLWGAINAVFDSWETPRAITYRRLNNIPNDWGTAVNVQSMVFGNYGDTSATGVAFTRDPSTGENVFLGNIF